MKGGVEGKCRNKEMADDRRKVWRELKKYDMKTLYKRIKRC